MAKRFDSLSIADARRIALAAQGFDTARPKTKATQRQVDALISRLGVIQIDSVNVLVRSQELPLFARLGNHDRNESRRRLKRKSCLSIGVMRPHTYQ